MAEGRTIQPEFDDAVPPEDYARQHLDLLFEIGTLLTRFAGAEKTLPELLSVVTRAVPLRMAVLIADSRDGIETVCWSARVQSADDLRDATETATRFLEYLVGAGSGRPMRSDGDRKTSLALPLVDEGRRIFGTLFVEADAGLRERDLAFVSAVAAQLAVAQDRYNAWRYEISLRRRAVFLADSSRMLAATLEHAATIETLARIVVPSLADFCIVDAIDANGVLIPGAAAHADASVLPALREATARHVLGPGDPVTMALADGRAHVVPEFNATPSDSKAKLPELYRAFGTVSLLVVPLAARGRKLGVISLARAASGREFGEADVTLVQSLASVAALAIDNARLYESAQRAARLRQDIVAVVSHDLKSPLNVILLYAMLVRDALPPGDRTREQVESIQRAGESMARLIADVLDAESIEGNSFAVDRSPCAVAELLDDATLLMRPLADQKYMLISLESDCPPEAMVSCDRERVLHVFSNLIGNAIKFTPAGGSIVVRSEPCDRGILFVVEDNGPGIAEDRLPHIFERYWRASSRDHNGAGLGLFIAKAIVEAHGGTIAATSVVGTGTQLAFTLPCASATDEPSAG